MKDLTLPDETQHNLKPHLLVTERLLAKAASAASRQSETADIWMMPDLGLSNNVARMHGGFFTGGLYKWTSRVPIVPIDATVNVCGVSVFRVGDPVLSRDEFDLRIRSAIYRDQDSKTSYTWNFASGNHFITYGRVYGSQVVSDGHYLVLHSSAAEFKKQHNGLYPSPGNWYHENIKWVHDESSGRYLRYIDGTVAERFFKTAKLLEKYNLVRHEYFAQALCGTTNLEYAFGYHSHYGMPDQSSVAIGCQWLTGSEIFLMLTAPNQPLYFVQPLPSSRNNITLQDNSNYSLYPHGFGKSSVERLNLRYRDKSLVINGTVFDMDSSLEGNESFDIRSKLAQNSAAELMDQILKICRGEIVGEMLPIFSYSLATCK